MVHERTLPVLFEWIGVLLTPSLRGLKLSQLGFSHELVRGGLQSLGLATRLPAYDEPRTTSLFEPCHNYLTFLSDLVAFTRATILSFNKAPSRSRFSKDSPLVPAMNRDMTE